MFEVFLASAMLSCLQGKTLTMIALILATKKELDTGFSNSTLISKWNIDCYDPFLRLLQSALCPSYPIGRSRFPTTALKAHSRLARTMGQTGP